MVVSNGLFDTLLFGALFLGLGLDAAFPALQGTAFLVACGAAIYMAAQEWSEALARRRLWTQEQLATAVALSTGGFIYFYFRNESDFVILVLSIGLMMASLMVAIATMAAFGACFKLRSGAPLAGYIVTAIGAFVMGALAGITSLEAPAIAKFAVLAISFVSWKVREKVAPPPNKTPAEASEVAPSDSTPESSFSESTSDPLAKAEKISAEAALAAAGIGPAYAPGQSGWQLMPKRGTLLDRFFPVLVIGTLMILSLRQSGMLMQSVAPPASASNGASNSVTSDAN